MFLCDLFLFKHKIVDYIENVKFLNTNTNKTLSGGSLGSSLSGGGRQPKNSLGCDQEGFFPNPQNCTKFYRCVPGFNGSLSRHDFNCPPATAWDTRLETCNHINQVPECSGSPPPASNFAQQPVYKPG